MTDNIVNFPNKSPSITISGDSPILTDDQKYDNTLEEIKKEFGMALDELEMAMVITRDQSHGFIRVANIANVLYSKGYWEIAFEMYAGLLTVMEDM